MLILCVAMVTLLYMTNITSLMWKCIGDIVSKISSSMKSTSLFICWPLGSNLTSFCTICKWLITYINRQITWHVGYLSNGRNLRFSPWSLTCIYWPSVKVGSSYIYFAPPPTSFFNTNFLFSRIYFSSIVFKTNYMFSKYKNKWTV